MMLEAFFGSSALMIVITGALVGIAGSVVGTFLVLRRNAMLSDAISHSIVLGIVVVWLLTHAQSGPIQIIGAALTGLLTVFLTELIASTRRVKTDAAIGLVFPALFAAGVLLLNLYARDVHIDEHTVLLGEIGFIWLDTIVIGGYEVPQSIVWMSVVALADAAFVVVFFKELKLSTFDPQLAAALGFAPTVLFYALLALTSTTAVAAFDAVFVIVPPTAAYLLTDRLVPMLLFACGIAILSSIAGYRVALWLDVSIGGMMALMTGAFLGLALLFGPRHGWIAREWRRLGERHMEAARTLVVHLYQHENTGRAEVENAVPALERHLGWNAARAQAILTRSRRNGLVLQEGRMLYLTHKGRETARALIEPWAPAR
ncbi:MAG: metal ABC transporter permease [Halofilum sp. (in: g-proteobacteria)]